jgi:protein ImuB
MSLRRLAPQLWIGIDVLDLAHSFAPSRTHEVLTTLAARAHELTPRVCIEPPDGLLLEVQGSLKLFGGLVGVKKKLAAELDRRCLRYHLCAAPTPLAALWFARCSQADVHDSSALAGRLSVLPLTATRWPDDVLAELVEMGIRAVGECLRLPRDGFARRIGAQYLEQLDRALGKRPDPRIEHNFTQALCSTVELSAEVTQTAALTSALQDVVARLVSELRRLQRQVLSLDLVLHHTRRPATREKLQLLEPTLEAQRLLGPLVTRLERLTLPAPVIALGLTALPVDLQIEEVELFDDLVPGQKSVAPAALVERLRARFGIEKVYGLQLIEDHRPERVWARRTDKLLQGRQSSTTPSLGTARPLWILPSPVRLTAAGDELCSTTLASELDEHVPERIESGWWDGSDVSRDYYAIITGQGQRLWIYKDHATRGWYLHGLFG